MYQEKPIKKLLMSLAIKAVYTHSVMHSITYFLKMSQLTRYGILLGGYWGPTLLLSTVYIFMTSIIGGDLQTITIALLTHCRTCHLLILCLFVSPSLSGASPLVSLCRRLLRARCYLHGTMVQSHLK